MSSRRIEFIAPSEEFVELINGLSKKFGITRTRYIIEHCLSPDYICVDKNSCDVETKKLLGACSNNLNQIAIVLNEMRLLIKGMNCVEYSTFAHHLNEISDKTEECRESLKNIQLDILDKDKELLSFVAKRKLLPEVTEFLENTDVEYLKRLKNRQND